MILHCLKHTFEYKSQKNKFKTTFSTTNYANNFEEQNKVGYYFVHNFHIYSKFNFQK